MPILRPVVPETQQTVEKARVAGTMTSASIVPELPEPRVRRPIAEELASDIQARPLVMPDFIHIKPSATSRNLSFRWIFNDVRRVSQCKAQGWRVAKASDIEAGQLSPYNKDGGQSFINGDLILMCIGRDLYLGALKYKHEVAAKYSDPGVINTISARQAATELGKAGAARLGNDALNQPKMVAFTPDGTDIANLPNNAEQTRIGHDGPAEILNR